MTSARSNEICTDFIRALGIDPTRCAGVDLRMRPGEVITVTVTLNPSPEEIQKLTIEAANAAATDPESIKVVEQAVAPPHEPEKPAKFNVHYRCPGCGRGWIRTGAPSDKPMDNCAACGQVRIKPYSSTRLAP